MKPSAIVRPLDVFEERRAQLKARRPSTKKFSPTALSQQLPVRFMLTATRGKVRSQTFFCVASLRPIGLRRTWARTSCSLAASAATSAASSSARCRSSSTNSEHVERELRFVFRQVLRLRRPETELELSAPLHRFQIELLILITLALRRREPSLEISRRWTISATSTTKSS